MARTHWFGEDVETIEATLGELSTRLPVFHRQPFGVNRFHDVITRKPAEGAEPLPPWREPLSPSQLAELKFLNKLGIKSGVVYLLE